MSSFRSAMMNDILLSASVESKESTREECILE